jgi:hypothetical protein
MCGCEDGEPATVWRRSLPRARKAHTCYECERVIAAGELYERSVALFEGEWTSTAVCSKCIAIREAWHDVEGCWALYGALRDDVRECLREMRRDPPEDRDEGDTRDPDPDCLAFGMRLRAHLGKYGPQLPRRAA